MANRTLACLLLLLPLAALAEELPKAFQGNWGIHPKASLELLKTSPKYQESDRNLERLKQIKTKLRMTIDQESVAITNGRSYQKLMFTVVSVGKHNAKIKAKVDDKAFDLEFRLINGKYLQMISSASDDMNYFAWAKQGGHR